MTAVGLPTMVSVQWHTNRRSILVWAMALVACMVGTATAIAGLYDTPAKIHSYAAAVASGDALAAINGRVEGLNSLGGVIQDEFGFLAAFLLPLLGISLVARSTRREEDEGRLEALLGGRIARCVPALAALVLAAAVITATAVTFALGLVAVGVHPGGAVLYAASLGMLALVFAGLAALVAQLTLHARGVYTWSLIALAAAYVLRGVGDVTRTWVTWLSPLGWAEKAAPFGPSRWWALLVPLGLGGLLAALALALADRRDLGSGLLRGGAGPVHASSRLRGPLGLAAWIHRPAMLGWLAGGVLLAGTMGILARQLVDAMAGNPALSDALGATAVRPQDSVLAMTQLYLAIIASGYGVAATGSLRREETAGRLEPRLAGTLSRLHWLTAHAIVILGGLALIVLASSVVLTIAVAWSMGDGHLAGRTIGAGVAYLPAECLPATLALALFGLVPRAFPLAWTVYAATAFIALLGPGLKLPGWARDMAPTTHVGNPPQGSIDGLALVVLAALATALSLAAYTGFHRRGIPQR